MSDLLRITGREIKPYVTENEGVNTVKAQDEQILMLTDSERIQLQDQMRKVCLPGIQIQANIVIARIVTTRIGYNTIRSRTAKFKTPFLGYLPENCVIKSSCAQTYTIY